MEDVHEEMRRVISKDLVAWARRGDDARMTEFASGIADIMVEVDAGRMAEARALMRRLIARRNEDLADEIVEAYAIIVEAYAIKADRAENWTKMRHAASAALKLDDEELGAMDGILSRVLGDETVAVWLDTYRGLGFEGMLRREATPEEMETLQRNPTLRLPLADEEEGQC